MKLKPSEFHARHFKNLFNQRGNGARGSRDLFDHGRRLGRRPALQNVEKDPHCLQGLPQIMVGGGKELRPAFALLLRFPARGF